VGTRKAIFADKIYPSNPIELNNFVKHFIPNNPIFDDKNLILLHVPHIDYYRGIEIYAAGYQALVNRKYDYVFLLGTSHQYGNQFAIFSEDDFETPIGLQKNACEITSHIIDLYGRIEALSETNLHATEHSLELQLPFLKYLLPDSKIIPIIFGSLHHLFPSDNRFDYKPYSKIVHSLVETINYITSQNKTYLFLTGVDIAHIGSFFGDKASLDNKRFEEIATQDKKYLELISELKGDELFSHIASDFDQRRVCGYSTMQVVVDVLSKLGFSNLEGLFGEYKQAYTAENDCCVTIASVGYYVGKSIS
jgi:AmmeMemoRadiSam system protein B